ncbi:hypothetical protein GC170_10315 [bacterium]|nr:hypothetical protein [bacterium]
MTDRRKFESALFEPVVRATIETGETTTSFVQRRFGLEYGSASRIVDRMCAEGVVSDELPDRSRVVLLTLEDWHRRNA